MVEVWRVVTSPFLPWEEGLWISGRKSLTSWHLLFCHLCNGHAQQLGPVAKSPPGWVTSEMWSVKITSSTSVNVGNSQGEWLVVGRARGKLWSAESQSPEAPNMNDNNRLIMPATKTHVSTPVLTPAPSSAQPPPQSPQKRDNKQIRQASPSIEIISNKRKKPKTKTGILSRGRCPSCHPPYSRTSRKRITVNRENQMNLMSFSN